MVRSLLVAAACVTPLSAQEPIVLVGLHVETPTIASLSVGRALQTRHRELLFAQGEPGIGGGRLSIGYVWLRTPTFIPRATVLRTWGPSWGAASGHTYAGPELQMLFTKRLFGARGGVLFPLGAAPRPAVTLGAAFGY